MHLSRPKKPDSTKELSNAGCGTQSSAWLHLFDFSPLSVFKGLLKWVDYSRPKNCWMQARHTIQWIKSTLLERKVGETGMSDHGLSGRWGWITWLVWWGHQIQVALKIYTSIQDIFPWCWFGVGPAVKEIGKPCFYSVPSTLYFSPVANGKVWLSHKALNSW